MEGEEKQLWNLPLLYSTASEPGETKLEMMAGETHTLKVWYQWFSLRYSMGGGGGVEARRRPRRRKNRAVAAGKQHT